VLRRRVVRRYEQHWREECTESKDDLPTALPVTVLLAPALVWVREQVPESELA